MKKKNLKLSLDKMTISRLNSNQASRLNGGVANTTLTNICSPCPGDTDTVATARTQCGSICPTDPGLTSNCQSFQKKCITQL